MSFARRGESGLFSDYLFSAREISRAYLGCRMPESDRAELLSLASGELAHVEFYQASQNERRYGLTFSRIR